MSTTKAISAVEVERVLVLSTGHVTAATGKMLDSDEGAKLWQLTWEYGWVFHVPPDGEPAIEMPEEICAALKIAHGLGCKWIRYDCDGHKIDDLPFYSW